MDSMSGFRPAENMSRSSGSPMSSPPESSIPNNDGLLENIHVASKFGDGVAAGVAAQPLAHTTSTATSASNGQPPEKPKRQRKKPVTDPNGKPAGEEKAKKPRRPRDPNKPPVPRTKKKVEENTAPDARQSTITASFQQPVQTAGSAALLAEAQHRASDSLLHSNLLSNVQHMQAPAPRPYSSGQNYDPIRGSTKESAPSRPTPTTNGTPSAHASPQVNRASASPAISSLIDPPMAVKVAASAIHSPQTTMPQPAFVPSLQSPPANKQPSVFAPPPQPQPRSPSISRRPSNATNDDAMATETMVKVASHESREIKAPSKSSSSAPTPKAARPTPPPVAPRGTGSGLLSSSDLFGGPSTSEPAERKGVNIDIHIPLDPAGGNTVNIAHEIVKKYGRDALNPRAAAHREQLLRIALEQNKFVDSNDEMSVDLMSDMEGDSNVEMGGMDDDKSKTGAETDKQPPRKRKAKVEEYDKDDDFIDDTELAWQEGAAVAKDGFFVYSGPLVPEGEAPQIETSAPTRGRGSRTRARAGRAAATGTTHASLADKTRDPAAPTRARARTTRGTGAPRKPRITKADRERMEAEKAAREHAAAGMGGPAQQSTGMSAAPLTVPSNGPPMQQMAPQPQQQSFAQSMSMA